MVWLTRTLSRGTRVQFVPPFKVASNGGAETSAAAAAGGTSDVTSFDLFGNGSGGGGDGFENFGSDVTATTSSGGGSNGNDTTGNAFSADSFDAFGESLVQLFTGAVVPGAVLHGIPPNLPISL